MDAAKLFEWLLVGMLMAGVPKGLAVHLWVLMRAKEVIPKSL